MGKRKVAVRSLGGEGKIDWIRVGAGLGGTKACRRGLGMIRSSGLSLCRSQWSFPADFPTALGTEVP